MSKLDQADITARAQGQAALMMLDSLTMALVDAKVVTVDRVVEAIEVTVAAKRGMLECGEDPEVVEAALGILSGLAASIAATPRT